MKVEARGVFYKASIPLQIFNQVLQVSIWKSQVGVVDSQQELSFMDMFFD